MPTDTTKVKIKMNRRDAIKAASAMAATTAAIAAPDKAVWGDTCFEGEVGDCA
jgi:hypothetical protein